MTAVSTEWWFRQAQPPRLGFPFPPCGSFDKLNHRDLVFGFHRVVVSTSSTTATWFSVSTQWWFRQAQPPRLGFRFLPSGGFDKLNHRDLVFGFHRVVVSTSSTTATWFMVSTIIF
jgi:hypothetical protein